MVVRELRLPPNPLALARALGDRPGLAVLASSPVGAWSPRDARSSFVACDPVEVCEDLVPPSSRHDARERDGQGAAPEWIGAIPYEAMREPERAAWTRSPDPREAPWVTKPRWQRYDAVLRVDHASGVVTAFADDDRAAARLATLAARNPERSRSFALEPSTEDDAPGAHVERVRAVLELIARGDVYQVNVARRLAFAFRGDALEAFIELFTASPTPYGFYADLGAVRALSTTPELALEARGAWLRTIPIKGTLPRGADAEDDRARVRALDADPKERAELTMAIDLHRNDLGRVAVTGSVRVLGDPRVIVGRTVLSRACEIVARRAPGVTNDALVRAMLPCGSVTGAPKTRAMEIIADLEPHRRGLYTGAIGYVARGGAMTLAMAIRTLEVHGDRARYWTGGGIVAGSVPERELDETRWKARHLPKSRPIVRQISR